MTTAQAIRCDTQPDQPTLQTRNAATKSHATGVRVMDRVQDSALNMRSYS